MIGERKEESMKYPLYREGKLGLLAWTVVCALFALVFSGVFVYASLPKGGGLECALKVIAVDVVIFIVWLAVFQHEKKKIGMYFTLDREKITVYASEEEKIDFFWSEILFSGICVRSTLYNNRYNRIEKLICFSKVWMTEEMKQSLVCGADERIVCIAYEKELVDAIRQYYDLPLEWVDISRSDAYMFDE